MSVEQCKGDHEPDWRITRTGDKVCHRCRHNEYMKTYQKGPGREKYIEYQRKNRADNLDARRAYDRERGKNPERQRAARERRWFKKYGLTREDFDGWWSKTREDFDGWWSKQDGKCAICNVQLVEGTKTGVTVDHCHVTGDVRGLLCGKCNSAIGHLNDDIELVRSALAYLERSNPN